jgi:hypothetical protein
VTVQTPYQGTLVATLEALGWQGTAVRPIFDGHAQRFLTPTTAEGWPDLTYINPRHGVLLACEVKSDLPKSGAHRPNRTSPCGCCPRPNQLEYLHRFHQCLSNAAVVFRPADDWNAVARMLAQPGMLMSGWGWLPEDEWRQPLTRQQAEALLSPSQAARHLGQT